LNFSEEQILTLAPDESSKKAGKSLASLSKWVTKGSTETALWGECQGSGSKPYQTGIDLVNLAFKCSCPSRKFPCKHGLGLALLYKRYQSAFSAADAPAWLTEWLSKRGEKEEKKTVKKVAVADVATAAKRQEAREQKVHDGITELHRWMKDLIRNGITSLPEKDPGYWEKVAKRMIDAQAPGLAGMVKAAGSINFYEEGWQTAFMNNLLDLYMVIQAYRNQEHLSPLIQQEIKAIIGFTQAQENLKEADGVTDTWLVAGKTVSQEEQLTVERHWLYGMHTGQAALVLQFYVKGQGGNMLALTPGQYLKAELVFYPSAIPLRAIIKHQTGTPAIAPARPFLNWQEVAEWETTIAAQMPVRSIRPYVLKSLTPVRYNDQWWLVDALKNGMPVKKGFTNIWRLLALSGGTALDTTVIGRETSFEPLGVWHQGMYKTL
jgi:hypothetical protein